MSALWGIELLFALYTTLHLGSFFSYLWNPLPSMRTRIKTLGRSLSSVSNSLTYSYFDFAIVRMVMTSERTDEWQFRELEGGN